MNLVFLPGMDGTGKLFYPLLENLPLNMDVKVIVFSSSKKQSYDEMVLEIKQQLPKTPFILVAESFSGVLAHRIALDSSLPLKKLVLMATFLENPRPTLLWLARFIPLSLMLSIPLPSTIFQAFCLANRGSAMLIRVLKDSLKEVDGAVLANRLRLISDLDCPTENLKLKTLIINPLNDKLIPKRVSSKIKSKFPNSMVIELHGPHFLAQICPKEVAAHLLEFAQEH